MSKPKKEVKIQVKLKQVNGKWELYLSERDRVLKNCLSLFQTDAMEIELEGIIKSPGKKKSKGKLGYFYAEILPMITEGLIDSGWDNMTEEIAYLWLCKRFNGVKMMSNEKTGEVMNDIITLSDLDDEQTSVFINSVIIFGNTDLNITFRGSEEYKQEQQNFENSVNNSIR